MVVNTPPMGWNSWNTFGAKISDQLIREVADKFVELGLDKAGYEYVVIDDCWSLRDRDPETGKIVADPEKFPEGMKALSDYVHSKGLKFGMYSCAGLRTCGNYPGSYGHEFLDAQTFAEFGCDFLKYDYCYFPLHGAYTPNRYLIMGNALRNCGRDILYSLCNWGQKDVWTWAKAVGGNMYRSTGDIFDNPVSYAEIARSQLDKYCYSGSSCFNDMDMLTVGMYGKGNVGCKEDEMTEEEKLQWYNRYCSQFGLWCIMGSPLMLGADIRNLDEDILKLVTNKDLIRINQDPECRQAFRVDEWQDEYTVSLAKLLSDGTIALGLFNFTDKPVTIQVLCDALGFPYSSGYTLKARDLFSGEEQLLTREVMVEQVVPFGCRMFILTPEKRG